MSDLSAGLRDAVGEQYGVPPQARYADVEQMLADADADATVLLTSGSHGAAALMSLRAGMPVFCEKPLADTVAEADALATLARVLDATFGQAVERLAQHLLRHLEGGR